MANRSLCGDRLGERSFLLVPDEAFPSGRSRFALGDPYCTPPALCSESVRYSARAVSPDCGFFCAAFRAPPTGNRRGLVLRNQFCSPGFWSYAPRVRALAHPPGLSLLARHYRGTVVRDHCRQRVLPAPAAGDHGKTADRTAGLGHLLQPARHTGMRGPRSLESRAHAKMAAALAWPVGELRAFHSCSSPSLRIDAP